MPPPLGHRMFHGSAFRRICMGTVLVLRQIGRSYSLRRRGRVRVRDRVSCDLLQCTHHVQPRAVKVGLKLLWLIVGNQ